MTLLNRLFLACAATLAFQTSAIADVQKLYSLDNFDVHLNGLWKNPLVIFDLDNTLYSPAQTLGSEQWFDYLVKTRIEAGQSKGQAIDSALTDWVSVQRATEVVPTEERTPATLRMLAKRGFTTLALTARHPAIADLTFSQLGSLGIVFTLTGFEAQSIPANDAAYYKNGVIFAGSKNAKGDVLLAFLKNNGLEGRPIVFVDNKSKHVENLDVIFAKGVYRGYRYTAADKWIEKLNSFVNTCAVERQWSEFKATGRFLTDIAAWKGCLGTVREQCRKIYAENGVSVRADEIELGEHADRCYVTKEEGYCSISYMVDLENHRFKREIRGCKED